MVANQLEKGFTIAEMIVALVIMSLFLIMFFQIFLSGQAQRLALTQRAAANDISESNLRKISSKALIPGTTALCDSLTAGNGNPNNLLLNSNAAGSTIASDSSTAPSPIVTWATAVLTKESLANTSLPNDSRTTQTLTVLYPQGCNGGAPAEIVSTVSFGTETAKHAAYVN